MWTEKKSVSNGMITHLSDRLSDSASLKDLAVSESPSFGFRCELLSCQRRGFSNDISGVFSSLSVIIVTCNKIIVRPLFPPKHSKTCNIVHDHQLPRESNLYQGLSLSQNPASGHDLEPPTPIRASC